jgi:hypothetical protein
MPMTTRTLLLAACCLLPACQPADQAVPATPGSTPASEIVASAETLAGEYRVAGIDGADVNLPHAITASVGPERMEFTSDCIRMAWTYRFESQVLVTETAPVASCRRALLAEEQALSEAVEAAGIVRRTEANGVELSGEGHTVLLFGQ